MSIERETVTGRVVLELRRMILSGALPEGTPLRQESLAAELGVSRIPLREAIRQLEAEELVTSIPHRGTVVAALSAAELEELMELRRELETWLFGLAIPRSTPADLVLAERLIAEAGRQGSAENWGELNWRFHAALYRPAGREVALRMLETVHRRAARYVNLVIALGRDVAGELDDHVRLVDHARAGDVAGGRRRIAAHVTRVAEIVGAALAQRRRTLELAG